MFKKIITLFFLFSTVTLCNRAEFTKIYSNTLRFEGKSYIKNNVEESKYGITKYYTKDVKRLSEEKAFEIAYKKIYIAHNLHKIQDKKIRAFVFDWIYNSSPKKAIGRIQTLLDVEVTGVMNSETVGALNNFSDTELLIFLLKENRLNYLKTLKHYNIYEKGWKTRIANIV